MKAEDLRDAVIKAIDSVSVPGKLVSIGIDFTKYSNFCTVSVNFHSRNTSVSYGFDFGTVERTTLWREDKRIVTNLSREQALEELKAKFEELGGIFDANNI